MAVTALYPGSFDPITNGHLDLIMRASQMFDRLVVAVGMHHEKSAMLSSGQRIDLIRSVASRVLPNPDRLDIITFDGLVVEAARANGAKVLVRGVRNGTDQDYEMQMFGMNSELAPDVDTIFLPSRSSHCHITASLVRQIAKMGGDISEFVPTEAAAALKAVSN